MATARNFNASQDIYKMNHRRRGYAVIIDNYEFVQSDYLISHENDVKNYVRTFGRLGFEIKVHKNLTAQNMESLMNKYANEDYSDTDCFLAIILSHGTARNNLEYILGSDDQLVSFKDLKDPFKYNKSLEGKPKIFFIDACRGSKQEPLSPLIARAIGDKYYAEADFLFGFASIRDHVSWSLNESLYSAELCKTIDEFSNKKDLLSMVTIAHKKVAEICKINKIKQTPNVDHTLQKDIYFTNNLNNSTASNSTSYQDSSIGHRWFYTDSQLRENAEFIKISRSEWHERKNQKFFAKFQEVGVGNSYVLLYDESRDMHVKLTNGLAEAFWRAKNTWAKFASGKFSN